MNNATKIAVRCFLSNVEGFEEEAYQYMEDCPRPYETYADDYFDDMPYRVWSKFSMDTVDEVLTLIDNLAKDIENTFNPPEPEDTEEDNDYDLEPEDTEALECPECGSANFEYVGKLNGEHEFKCIDCGEHFNG